MERTIWNDLRCAASDTLLLWAIKLLPTGSSEHGDLLSTLIPYMRRSIERLESAKTSPL